MARDDLDLDYEDQECKSYYCEHNEDGTCTEDSEEYEECEGKDGI